MAKDSLLGMTSIFVYIISDVDKGKTYRKEKLKNSFKNGIMTGTTCFMFMAVIVIASAILSASMILITNPDSTERFEGLSLSICIIVIVVFILIDIAVMFYPETASLVFFTVILTFLAYMTFGSLPMALLFATGFQLMSVSVKGIMKIMEPFYYVVSLGDKGFFIYHIIFTELHIDPDDNTALFVICTSLPVALIIGAAVFMRQRKFNRDGSLCVHIQQFYKRRTLLLGLLCSVIPLIPYRQEIMDGLFVTSKNAVENVYSFAMSHLILTFIVLKILIAVYRRWKYSRG